MVGNPISCPTYTDTYVQGSSESRVHHRWWATPFIVLRTQIHTYKEAVSHGYITGGEQPHSSSYVHRYMFQGKKEKTVEDILDRILSLVQYLG